MAARQRLSQKIQNTTRLAAFWLGSFTQPVLHLPRIRRNYLEPSWLNPRTEFHHVLARLVFW